MKAMFGAAVVAAALVSWQPAAHAGATLTSQPLTRAACSEASLAWDESRNVCDWYISQVSAQPLTRIACDIAGLSWDESGNVCDWPTALTIEASFQPLTRTSCDKAGLIWDESGNVCDWQPKAQLASDATRDATGAVTWAQPLTRDACDKAGLAWNESGNVCAS